MLGVAGNKTVDLFAMRDGPRDELLGESLDLGRAGMIRPVGTKDLRIILGPQLKLVEDAQSSLARASPLTHLIPFARGLHPAPCRVERRDGPSRWRPGAPRIPCCRAWRPPARLPAQWYRRGCTRR